MKVKELKELLDLLVETSPEAAEWEVVMSKDGEGNNYSPLCDMGAYIYMPDSTWSGEIREPDDEDDEDDGQELNAICLWPTN